jgi:hypothetical protein
MDVAKVERDVAYVSMGTVMLQMSVPNVSSVFSNICCKCVYLNVAYISHICCNCFMWMSRMCCNSFQLFRVFVVMVSDVCFIYLQMYVANVVFGYLKSKLGVASPSSPWCLLLAFCCLASFSDRGGVTSGDGGGT